MAGTTLSLFANNEVAQTVVPIANNDVSYKFITDPSEVPQVIDTLTWAPSLAYDLEFSNLNPWKSFQHLWQLSDGFSIFVGVTQLVSLDLIAPLLMKPLIGHNLVTERKQTLIATQGRVKIDHLLDTMFAYQVAKAGLLTAEWGGIGTAGLDSVYEQYTGRILDKKTRKEFITHPWQTYIETLPAGWQQDPRLFAEAQDKARLLFTPAQQIYAANDVRDEHQAWFAIREELIGKGLYHVAMRECHAITIYADLESVGWTVDTKQWSEHLYKRKENEDGTVTETGLIPTQEKLIKLCEPLLLEGLNNQEKKNEFDFVSKGSTTKHRTGGRKVKTRADHGKVELLNKEGQARFAKDVQRRLFTLEHNSISMTKRTEVQDAFTGLGINLETMDKQAISDALDGKLTDKKRGLLKAALSLAVVTKLLGTYGQNILDRISEDGTLWFDLNMLGASATGRNSSANPNLQNVPARGEVGEKFRSFFIAAPGSKLIIADYSSLEQRIAAHCSQDPRMMQIYFENLDIHCMSASGMFGFDYYDCEKAGKYDRETGVWGDKKVAYDFVQKLWIKTISRKDDAGTEVSKTYQNALTEEVLANFIPSSNFQTIKYMRDEVAKTCSFASNYGGDAHTLARSLKGKTAEQLEEIYNAYRKTYATMFKFMDASARQAWLNGYTTNFAGRKRFYYPTEKWESRKPFRKMIHSKSLMNGIKRQGMNTPVQSGAADIMKDAMQLIYDEFRRLGWWKIWGPGTTYFGAKIGAAMICSVHDEIIVRADEEIADEVAVVVKQCMLDAESFYLTTVPPGASCHVGTSWSDK